MSDKYNKEEQSVLQKIQNQTGCLLLIIGIAMLAFVLTDLVGSGASIFGSNKNVVGKIAGQDVTYEEFTEQYETFKAAVLQNNPGIAFNEVVAKQYRQQAWDFLVDEKVQNKEYEELGIDVSPAEMEDITIGDNTHQQIKQSFQDPETGEFDKTRLERFLKDDINNNSDARASWVEFQKQFTKQIIASKYTALTQSSLYVTDLEARNKIKADQLTINATVVNVPYNSIADSTISVSDSEIEAYIKEHKSDFEQEESRDIEFIALRVIPSADDSMNMLNWAQQSIERLQNASNDSVFVANSNSESPYDPTYRARGTFSPEVEERLFEAEVGTVIGPFEKNGVYSVFKVSGIGEDSLRSVRGSHIVFRVNGTTDEDTANAMTEAREVLSKIRSGQTTFEAEASNRNFDATRTQGGDMGWVREGNYTYPKKVIDRLMTSGKDNLVIIKSNRGIHIAKATSNVSRKTVQVALLDQTIYASTETDAAYNRTAGEFLVKLDGDQSFQEVAESMGLVPRIAPDISEEQRNVAGVSNGNVIARWLYADDTEEGDISPIMSIDDTYIVAKVTKIKEAGTPSVEDARKEVEPLVRNAKKAEIITKKFEEALTEEKDAETLAKELETVASIVPAASFNSGNLPYIGQDLKVMGTIFGTPVGKRSQIIEGKNGVVVVYVNNENEYEKQDVTIKKSEIDQFNLQAVGQMISDALMDKAEVKEQLYKFFD